MPFTSEFLSQHTIARFITGSTAYNLNKESSDVDEKAVVALPREHFFTIGQEWETECFHEPQDLEFHSVKKFLFLLKQQNPTALSMVYSEPTFHKRITPAGFLLIKHRDLFLTNGIMHTFSGYAREQLYRIESTLRGFASTSASDTPHLALMLENIMQKFPKQYPAYTDGSIRLVNVFDTPEGKKNANFSFHLDAIPINQLQAMVTDLHSATKGYNKLNHRNKKPEEKLEKHAMHLVLMLKLATEAFRDGTLHVFREHDREFFMDIREGKYTWPEFFELIQELEDDLKQAQKKSILPQTVDETKINQLYHDMMALIF